MKIAVPVKLVPDLVEELEVDDSGAALDTTWLRLILNETDEHAIEQSILLKERDGSTVTVVTPDVDGADDVLYAACAKGADHLIKLGGDFEQGVNNHALARALEAVLRELQPDLVLTGVQAHDDLDGPLGALLAVELGIPYVGYISNVKLTDGVCVVHKEYPGGLIAEMEVVLPAVLGIQSAEEPPRYVAISKIRQASQTAAIEEQAAAIWDRSGGPAVARMFQPESGERATMLPGDEEEVAARLVEVFKELGVL